MELDPQDRSASPGAENDPTNPGQQHYDDVFGQLTSAEHMAKTGTPGELNGKPAAQTEENTTLDTGELATAEASGAADHLGKGFTPYDTPVSGRLKEVVRLHKSRRLLIGGGIVGGLLTLFVALFIALLPLKINSIVENLQNRFFATANQAVEKETDNLFSNYLKQHVLPSLLKPGCSDTRVDKNCVAAISGTSPVAKLYDGWRQGRLENKLATNYGILFGKDSSGRIYMKAPGLPAGGIDMSYFEHGNTSIFDYGPVGRSEARQEMKNALKSETKFDRVMMRFKVGRLLEEKYGIKRCMIACNTRDKFADSVATKKAAFKARLVERVIEPRSTLLADAVNCLLDPACHPEEKSSTDGVEGDATNGERMSTLDNNLKDDADAAALRFGEKSLGDLAAVVDDINKSGGISNYIIPKVVKAMTGKEVSSETIGSALGPLKWAQTAAQTISALHTAGPKVKMIGYAVQAASMVPFYMMWRTVADEAKSGHMDATELGSYTDALSSGQKDGEGPPAEGAPLYGPTIDGTTASPAVASLLNSALPSADALSSSSAPDTTHYKCDSGKIIPAGKWICPEEELGQGSATLNAISSELDTPPFNLLTILADAYNNTLGKAFSFFSGALSGAISSIPGVDSITNLISKAVSPLMTILLKQLFPSAISTNMSGARAFDMMYGGADIAGNDFAHHGLGGVKLTPQQTADIVNEQQRELKNNFDHQPFFARMFSTDSPYSFVSRLAVAMPSNLTSMQSSMASMFSNPFGTIFSGIGNIFSPSKAFAAVGPQEDPFGISQYGYPADDPVFTTDPATYWAQHNCDQEAANGFPTYNSNTTINPDTGVAENTADKSGTDGCMLIQAAIGSAGALYDSSLLTQDDLGDSNGVAAESGAPTSTAAGHVSGSAQDLAKQILANKNIQLEGRDVRQDIQDAASNKPGTAGAMTSAAILQLIATIGQDHSVQISAIQSGGSGHCNGEDEASCPNDPHYVGDAVDFSALDGTALSGRDSGSIFIMKTAFGILPSGSGFGQNQCGTTPPLPAGDTSFDDTCNHLHVQVPAGTP